MPRGTIITLQEVQDAFFERGIHEFDKEKIAELYYLIDDHGYVCLRDPGRAWVPNMDEDDERMACNEIADILELDHSIIEEYYMVVVAAVQAACERFTDMTMREKVPFYIVALHELLP
ncbi:hypothetical protein [Sulfurimonas diazotrophicus]|uniref:Uncharacterized protein n=1 Tax=Sulfurimonas diazotrophicus TaxID=3131939 RepID=A0ABZ3H6U2_9BACT